MEPHPGEHAVLPLQPEGHLPVVGAEEVHRDHPRPVEAVVGAQHPQAVLLQLLHPVPQVAGELPLPLPQRLALLRQVVQGGPQAEDAGQVQGARLQPVGQEGGHGQGLRQTPRAAGHQGLQLRGQGVRHHQAADALGAQQALVAGEGQAVDAHGRHVHRHGAQGLGSIHQEEDPPLPAQGAHLSDGKQGARHVGGVGEHHRPYILRQALRQAVRQQLSPVCTGQILHRHPLALQLFQGPQDGVVLHGGGEHLVAGPQQAVEQEVEAIGGPRREAHVPGIRAVHQGAQLLPHRQHPAGGVPGPLIAPPADVAAHMLQVVRHGRPHAGGLGERGGRIVQVDGLVHRRSPSMPQGRTEDPARPCVSVLIQMRVSRASRNW